MLVAGDTWIVTGVDAPPTFPRSPVIRARNSYVPGLPNVQANWNVSALRHEPDLLVVPVTVSAEALQVYDLTGLVGEDRARECNFATDFTGGRARCHRDHVLDALEQHRAVTARSQGGPDLVDGVVDRHLGGEAVTAIRTGGRIGDRGELVLEGAPRPQGDRRTARLRGRRRAGLVEHAGDRDRLTVRDQLVGGVDRESRDLLLLNHFRDRVRGAADVAGVTREQHADDVVAGEPPAVGDRVVRSAVETAALEGPPGGAGVVLLLEENALTAMVRGDRSGERDRLTGVGGRGAGSQADQRGDALEHGTAVDRVCTRLPREPAPVGLDDVLGTGELIETV